MQVGLARGRARSVVGGTRCSWSRSAGPSLLGRYPGASEWTAEQVAEHWGCISDSRCRHCRGRAGLVRYRRSYGLHWTDVAPLVPQHSDFDRLHPGQSRSGRWLGSTSTSILRAFVEERISGKAPPWSPRESKKAILKMPLTRATSGASMTQEVGFHAARTTGRRSLALGRTPPPCLGGRGCVSRLGQSQPRQTASLCCIRDQPRKFRTLLRDFRRPCPCCTHRLHPPIEPPLGPTHQFRRSKKLLPRHHFHDPPPDGSIRRLE